MSLLTFTKKIFQREQPKARPAKQPANGETRPAAEAQPEALPGSVDNSLTLAGSLGLWPLVTEKSFSSSATPRVVFRVHPRATKGQISRAVAQRYHVVPVAVRTVNLKPKQRRRGTTRGQTSAWKKAYVTLPAGKTIDVTV